MEKRGHKRRIVLVPTPGQGHLTPLMQLGKALQVNGFSITVIHGQSNQISSSSSQNFQDFDFITMPETLPEPQGKKLGPVESVMKLNQTVVSIFKDCIARLLLQQGNDIACIIYDALMYFCEGVAKEFKIPCAIFCTTSATNQVCCRVLSKLNMEGLFRIFVLDPFHIEWPAFKKMIKEFETLFEYFTDFRIKYIPRDKNSKADKLARSERVHPLASMYVSEATRSWVFDEVA